MLSYFPIILIYQSDGLKFIFHLPLIHFLLKERKNFMVVLKISTIVSSIFFFAGIYKEEVGVESRTSPIKTQLFTSGVRSASSLFLQFQRLLRIHLLEFLPNMSKHFPKMIIFHRTFVIKCLKRPDESKGLSLFVECHRRENINGNRIPRSQRRVG